ncbi:diaminopimelate decarboxylase [soil metagenome]
MNDTIPFDKDFITSLDETYPTPNYIYDELRIRSNAKALRASMDDAGVQAFKNYFAVKALPNPHILKLLHAEGMGADCSSLAELELADRAGFKGSEIMFTSNNTTMEEFGRAHELGAIINFDDISLVQPYLDQIGVPDYACCRYNPGDIEFDGVNEQIIGMPSQAKYGMTKPQILEAYSRLKRAGVKHLGLHTMLLSNELDFNNHERIADLLFSLAAEIARELDITFETVNLGGGIGVPYRPEEKAFDVPTYARALVSLYEKHGLKNYGAPRIVMENGRFITADAGYLVTKVINHKHTHKTYVGVDASMSNLMRPGMYGAYHHITVLGKESTREHQVADVVGALCENNDKFAIDRDLPVTEEGDYIVIHTVGAHGHAMGFQYNGKLRSAELLLKPDKSVQLIRRAETLDDYFATLTGPIVAIL